MANATEMGLAAGAFEGLPATGNDVGEAKCRAGFGEGEFAVELVRQLAAACRSAFASRKCSDGPNWEVRSGDCGARRRRGGRRGSRSGGTSRRRRGARRTSRRRIGARSRQLEWIHVQSSPASGEGVGGSIQRSAAPRLDVVLQGQQLTSPLRPYPHAQDTLTRLLARASFGSRSTVCGAGAIRELRATASVEVPRLARGLRRVGSDAPIGRATPRSPRRTSSR